MKKTIVVLGMFILILTLMTGCNMVQPDTPENAAMLQFENGEILLINTLKDGKHYKVQDVIRVPAELLEDFTEMIR